MAAGHAVSLLSYLACICFSSAAMSHPRIAMMELERGITFPSNEPSKKVLEGILNDYMALQYGVDSPYTKGQTVLPLQTTEQDLAAAIKDPSTDHKFRAVFEVILDKWKSGDMTPEVNDGTWDPKLTPVLVLVSPRAGLA